MNLTSTDFRLLRIAQLKGMASSEQLRAATPAAADDLDSRVGRLLDAGLLQQLPRGLRVTAAGRDWLGARLRQEAHAVDTEASRRVYEAFTPINQEFKQLIYDWQMRNNHQDAAYDDALILRLRDLHLAILPVLEAAACVVDRLAPYRDRFAAALRRIDAGEWRYVAAPLIDSYHTVWFELHEDLLSITGLSRKDEARAGRAD